MSPKEITEKNLSNLQGRRHPDKTISWILGGCWDKGKPAETLKCLRQGTAAMIGEVSESWELGRYYFRDLGGFGFIHFSLWLGWAFFHSNFFLSKKTPQSNGMNEEVSLQGPYFPFFFNTQGGCERDWKSMAFSLVTILWVPFSFPILGREEFDGDGDSDGSFCHICSRSENHLKLLTCWHEHTLLASFSNPVWKCLYLLRTENQRQKQKARYIKINIYLIPPPTLLLQL